MIPKETIDRIFSAADIVQVVGEFVSLKKRGENYLGLCPFHNEKTPSFTVSPRKGIFKCFGCQKGGNAVNFLMELEHLSYPEALKYLARKYHIEIEEHKPTPEELEAKTKRESMVVVTNYAAKFFQNALHNTNEGIAVGLSYFKERGFKPDTIRKFGLGYSPEKRDAFTNEAQKNSYKLEYLKETGLTVEKNGYIFDRFSGRVMFPIHSLSGTIVGFGGRILKKDAKTAKYLNSPESEIYHKSDVLYGIFFARQSIGKNDKCFLVEGYTDVLALHQAGIENVVASSGTALTVNQIRLIKRFTENLTILYDGDPAGIKASIRGIDLVLEQGMNVKIVLLPEGEDPDSYSKKVGAEELLEFIEQNERDFITFKASLLFDETQHDPVKKARAITDIVNSIARIPESIPRSVYIKESSKLLDVEEKILYAEVSKFRRKNLYQTSKKIERESQKTKTEPQQTAPSKITNQFYMLEREILRVLLNYGSQEFRLKVPDNDIFDIIVSEFIVSELEVDSEHFKFTNPLFIKMFEEYAIMSKEYGVVDIKHFTNHPNPEISKLSADLVSSPPQLSKIWTKADNMIFTDEIILEQGIPWLIMHYKDRRLHDKLSVIKDKMKEIKNPEEQAGLMNEFMTLKRVSIDMAKRLGERTII